MKTFTAILALALAACGSSGPPPKTCDAGLCSGVCCASNETCFTDLSSGTQSCAENCTISATCPTTAPCCEPILIGGSFSGTSICAPTPPSPSSYYCSCKTSNDCPGQECVPAALDMSGALSGPYVCKPNDGQNHDGCANSPICSVSQQYCAADESQNHFCSYACTSDTDCNNDRVACCNANCRQGSSCCGLCGH